MAFDHVIPKYVNKKTMAKLTSMYSTCLLRCTFLSIKYSLKITQGVK